MKLILWLLIILLHSSSLFSQKIKKITKKDENRIYKYEVLNDNQDIKNGVYLEYNLDKNKELEGKYLNNLKEGEWKKYDNDERIISIETFLNDKRNGKARYFEYRYADKTKPPTGIIEGQYINDLQQGTWIVNEKIIKIQTNITYYQGKKHGLYEIKSIESSNKILIGKYKEDKRDSIWLFYNKEGKLQRELFFQNDIPQKNGKFYRNDTLILEYNFDENKIVKNNVGKPLFLDKNTEDLVENMSSPSGGVFFSNKFRKQVQKVLEYPSIAKRKGIDGTVEIRITVLENGEIEKIEAIKSPDKSLEDAAIIAIKKTLSMNNWMIIPAIQNGQPIKSAVNFPLMFKLAK